MTEKKLHFSSLLYDNNVQMYFDSEDFKYNTFAHSASLTGLSNVHTASWQKHDS